MTNKEKEQYLTDLMLLMSNPFVDEIFKINNSMKFTPKILYKYRPFDKWTYDMLKEPYVYLTPVTDLDDPFDCLTNVSLDNKLVKKGDENISLAIPMIDFLTKTISDLGNVKIDKKLTKQIADECYPNGEFNMEKAFNFYSAHPEMTEYEKQTIVPCLANIDGVMQTIISDETTAKLVKTASDPGQIVGVCSLTTKRDNKVMWSLYGKQYKGCCIEYEIPNVKTIITNLCPVIYKRNHDNDLIHNLVRLGLANCMRFASSGRQNRGIGCFNELFCTKDTDWAYQDEWRLIGDAKDHCNLLKIKAVYLGFKVAKTNIKKIKSLAKKKDFKVFLMNAPSGKKKITYKELAY